MSMAGRRRRGCAQPPCAGSTAQRCSRLRRRIGVGSLDRRRSGRGKRRSGLQRCHRAASVPRSRRVCRPNNVWNRNAPRRWPGVGRWQLPWQLQWQLQWQLRWQLPWQWQLQWRLPALCLAESVRCLVVAARRSCRFRSHKQRWASAWFGCDEPASFGRQ